MQKIEQLLSKLSFQLTKKEMNTFKDRLTSGDRYAYVVGSRVENGETRRRFLKVLVRNDFRTHKLFARQIYFTRFLKKTGTLPTRDVIKYNINPLKGVRYAIFETYEKNDKIGFLDDFEEMEALSEEHGCACARALFAFHNLNLGKVDWRLKMSLKRHKSSFSDYEKDIKSYLGMKVKPLDKKGRVELFNNVLSRRLGVEGFGKKALKLAYYWKSEVQANTNKGRFLVHGDLAPCQSLYTR